MLEIKNLLFQPLCLHLKDSNKSIHLTSRARATIQEKDLSQEIKKKKNRGWISIREHNKETSPKSPASTQVIKKTKRA